MLDYIVPIIISAVMAHNFTASTPELTFTPEETYKDSYSVEVKGKENSRVFVNGIEVATLKSNGKAYIDLNTSGAYGSTKDFQISLKNKNNQETQTLSFSIDKIEPQTSRLNAIKLLRQSSFTSYETQIDEVMINGEIAWIKKQLSTIGDLDDPNDDKYGYLDSLTRMLNKIDSATYTQAVVDNPFTKFPEYDTPNANSIFSRSIWWQKALHNEDQLRQRIAYALSQLVVASQDGSASFTYRGESLANYYDILVRNSFGNYRKLLKDVTMSASMAEYLTYIGSSKENNSTAPDENYARELMQLFTIGLYELNDDGTKKLNANDSAIPIYTQDDVSEMARVFTGFSLGFNEGISPTFRNTRYTDAYHYAHSWLLPIQVQSHHEKFHDYKEKTVLGQSIAADLSPEAGIDRAIDILMSNNNMAPHVCRSLISRLVTSNPTPEYMTRVVKVFNDNGAGVKGDLKATIRAILTDKEAREKATSNSFGKVDEYNLVTTHYMSAFKIKAPTTRKIANTDFKDKYWIAQNTQYYHQSPMNAPSVFNFYSPEYVPSDTDFSSENLVAPEFEQRSNNELMSFSDYIQFSINRDPDNEEWQYVGSYHGFSIDLTEVREYFSMQVDGNSSCEFYNLNVRKNGYDQKVVSEHGKIAIDKLIDYLDNLLMGGIMPDYEKARIKEHLLTSSLKDVRQAENIIRRAIQGIIMSPSYMVLK